MVGYKQSKRPSGVGIAGLVLGAVGTAAAVGAWIFAPIHANAKANQAKEAAISAKELSNAQFAGLSALVANNNANTNATLDRLINTLAAERQERIAGDVTLTNTVNNSVSGSQQGTLTAQQASELSALQVATNTVTTGLMTGQYSQNPQRVALYRDATPCGCPATGCGCNG
jgi:hypothetical protein